MSNLEPLRALIAEWRGKANASTSVKNSTYKELKEMEPFDPNRVYRVNTHIQMVVAEDVWNRAANDLERVLKQLEADPVFGKKD